jgi:thymidylate synthase
MKQWLDLMEKVLKNGEQRQNRTGVNTLALFGETIEFNDIGTAFPAVTVKKLAFKQVCAELSCFLRGYDNLTDFWMVGCHIWDENANADYWTRNPNYKGPGDVGRIYGVQWRDWRAPGKDYGVDQIKILVQQLRDDPTSRRLVVTAWNPGELDRMCLPPCHTMFQCFVQQGALDMLVNLRSVDVFLGLPFDVASYAVLQHLLARQAGLYPRNLKFMLGDTHIYMNHMEAVGLAMKRVPMLPPRLQFTMSGRGKDITNFHPDDVELVDYKSHPAIPAAMNV